MPHTETHSTTPRKRREPKLRLHKPTGQGFVEFDGKRHYLGRFDKPETRQKFHRLLSVWHSNGQELPPTQEDITVLELAASYMRWAETYYVQPDSSMSSELSNVKRALRALKDSYGTLPAKNFTPLMLKSIREDLIKPKIVRKGAKNIERRLTRRGINKVLTRIKHVFRWATSEGLIGGDTWQALQAVEGLRQGRSVAMESEPVRPVPESHIDAVKPYVSRQLWAVVQLQLLTGARPTEILRLRPVDINTSNEVWEVKVAAHKTSHRGKDRLLFLGPRAQRVIKPFLDRALDSFLISPQEAEHERHAKAEGHRREDQIPDSKKTDRVIRDHYDAAAYRRAIRRACAKAEVPAWNPYRLRHNAGTRIRREYGLEAAQVALGHALANVTQIYAERDFDKARAVFAQIG